MWPITIQGSQSRTNRLGNWGSAEMGLGAFSGLREFPDAAVGYVGSQDERGLVQVASGHGRSLKKMK